MQNELLDWCLKNYGQEVMQPGLTRIRTVVSDLLPQFQQTKIIIIAGTNGKGETALRLSELFKNSSFCTWTSPHIKRITERFRDEQGEIDPKLLKDLFLSCHEVVQKKNVSLSFYEFLFFVFCSWAANKKPKFLLLEVGLGGRLDAVNIFDADLVLLPSISRDHQEILGNRFDKILEEKLGTLRKKTMLMHFLDSDYLCEKTLALAKGVGARVVELRRIVNIPEYEFSLRNHMLATAAFSFLTGTPFSPDDSHKTRFSLEHRGEVKKGDHEWIFYGSHNVDGMRKLIQFLHSGNYNFNRPPYDSVIVAFSKRPLGDIRVMMKMLKASSLGKIVVTTFPHQKAESNEVMETLSREEGLDFVQDINTYVQGKNKNQRMLVSGSYYFMGYLKSLPCCR